MIEELNYAVFQVSEWHSSLDEDFLVKHHEKEYKKSFHSSYRHLLDVVRSVCTHLCFPKTRQESIFVVFSLTFFNYNIKS